MNPEFEHRPVLLEETMEFLRVRPGGVYLDGTLGLGGHGAAILEKSSPDGKLFAADRDAQALAEARVRLREFGDRVVSARGNYADFDRILPVEPGGVDGALVDLGVSSLQLMDPVRGFSFMREGPLDMRMDASVGETAADYLKRVDAAELEARLRDAGEDRFARKLAALLIDGSEKWRTTSDVAEAVARSVPRRGKSHPATRVFLALRMAVNGEMEGLKIFLEKIPAYLKSGGRLAVITFHSFEDGFVKRFYAENWKKTGVMKKTTKSPILPTWEERKGNRRSRSAKMRVFEKI